jgi:flagellar assembly factor FliW
MVTTESSTEALTVATAHSGLVRVRMRDMLYFATPLAPFLHVRRYTLLGREEEAPFLWLQAVDEPALALVVAPYEAVTGQTPPEARKGLRRALGLQPNEAPEVYVIVCVGADAAATTMNLLAPLYVCRTTRRAQQQVLDAELDLARAPVLPQPA